MDRIGTTFFHESRFRQGGPAAILKSQLAEALIKAASPDDRYDVFLSHSSRDRTIVTRFKEYLTSLGLSTYVDWIADSDAGRAEIAGRLKTAMHNSVKLLYLHTHNSRSSVWTPWEVGFFDGAKGAERIGVVPLLNVNNRIATYAGHEYLLTYTEVGADALPRFLGARRAG